MKGHIVGIGAKVYCLCDCGYASPASAHSGIAWDYHDTHVAEAHLTPALFVMSSSREGP